MIFFNIIYIIICSFKLLTIVQFIDKLNNNKFNKFLGSTPYVNVENSNSLIETQNGQGGIRNVTNRKSNIKKDTYLLQ